MSIRDAAWNLAKWKVMKGRLGYSDEEMKAFREYYGADSKASRGRRLS